MVVWTLMQCVGIWLPSFSLGKWFVCTKYNCSKVKHLQSMKIYLKKPKNISVEVTVGE